MKASVIYRFGEPDVFENAEIPAPIFAEDQLLIEVDSGSVNPIDWKQRRGNHRFLFGSPFPIVLGYDVAGTVIEKGEKTIHFSVGDKVCGVLDNKYGGGLGKLAKGSEKCFAKIPEISDAAFFGALPLAGLTALQGLRDKAQLQRGEKILIIGAAGGVGHFVTQIASIIGAEIYAVSSNRHEGFLYSLAPVTFIDYRVIDILCLKDKFDVIFDTVGKYSYPKCIHLLNKKGRYINTLPRPKILFHKILSVFSNGKKAKTLLMKHSSSDLDLLVNWVNSGKLKICIDKEFNISELGKAHAYSESGHTEGKILIRYN